jgi:hypothetical protein
VFEQEYVRGVLDQVSLGDHLGKRVLDAVVFVGDGEEFLAVCQELERRHLSPILLAAAGVVGNRAFAIPSSLQSKVYLAAAIQPPTEQDREQLQIFAGQHHLRNLGYARMAQAAATMFGDALMKVGRRVNRSLLVDELERYRKVDAGAGLALSYGAQSRIGSS